MEQVMPLAARIGLRLLTMLGLFLSVAWSIQSWGYESVIALITASCAALVGFAAGKSTMYEVFFGFGRVIAYTMCGAVLALLVNGISSMFVEPTTPYFLMVLISCMVLGLVYGVYLSFREVSISSERLVDRMALSLLLKGLPLLMFLLWSKEIKSAIEMFLAIPAMALVTAIVVIILADQGMFAPEGGARGEKERA